VLPILPQKTPSHIWAHQKSQALLAAWGLPQIGLLLVTLKAFTASRVFKPSSISHPLTTPPLKPLDPHTFLLSAEAPEPVSLVGREMIRHLETTQLLISWPPITRHSNYCHWLGLLETERNCSLNSKLNYFLCLLKVGIYCLNFKMLNRWLSLSQPTCKNSHKIGLKLLNL
jgi:hypothetical protein